MWTNHILENRIDMETGPPQGCQVLECVHLSGNADSICARGIGFIEALSIKLKLVLDMDRILSYIPEICAGLM
jgi:hypothetical protein